MRINMYHITSNLTNKGFDTDPAWLQKLIIDFGDYNDINIDLEDVIQWIYSPEGVEAMVNWMKLLGYNCAYYEIMKFDSKTDVLAYGIDIADNCEKFTELKLKL